MANIIASLSELMKIDGAVGCSVVDYMSGMNLGNEGGGVGLDLDLAGAGNSQVVRAKMETMKSIGLEGQIEDMLITLENQIHIIRPTSNHDSLYLYLILDRGKANLALARRKVQSVEEELTL